LGLSKKVGLWMNDLGAYAHIFDAIKPWSGIVPRGYSVDFLGTLTDVTFRQRFRGDRLSIGGGFIQTVLPALDNMKAGNSFDTINWRGEGWFEAVNWFAAAAEAKDRFVMITLGAWHGSQAVGSYRAIQLVNPMPCKLVAVEPVPESIALTRRHFRNNGIDPDDHWFIPMAVSDCTEPVLFAIGPRLAGPQNCFSTNAQDAREKYYQHLVSSEKTKQALHNLLLRNSTGISIPGEEVWPGDKTEAEIKYVSAITLNEVLAPFDKVDYLESDIQQSEIVAFPGCMDLIKRKVRRVHIGTHGTRAHDSMLQLFRRDGWEIVFNYEPNSVHETTLGTFRTGDGLLTFKNVLL
jgi:hypothetical protein